MMVDKLFDMRRLRPVKVLQGSVPSQAEHHARPRGKRGAFSSIVPARPGNRLVHPSPLWTFVTTCSMFFIRWQFRQRVETILPVRNAAIGRGMTGTDLILRGRRNNREDAGMKTEDSDKDVLIS